MTTDADLWIDEPPPTEEQAPAWLELETPQGIELDPQHPEETLPEYRARVLRYALRYGPTTLDAAQLRAADAAAQAAASSLPAYLEKHPGAATFDEHLHTLRLRIAEHQERRRLAWKELEEEFRELDEAQALDETAAQDEAPAAQETDQERAIKLLRAALTLVMQPPAPGQNGGGRPAPLQPQPPGKGPGAQADDRTPAPPGRRF